MQISVYVDLSLPSVQISVYHLNLDCSADFSLPSNVNLSLPCSADFSLPSGEFEFPYRRFRDVIFLKRLVEKKKELLFWKMVRKESKYEAPAAHLLHIFIIPYFVKKH